MTNNNILDIMSSNQYTAQSAYLDFIQRSEFYNTHVFCFYEGLDDSKYYKSRIETKFDKIMKIVVGGKREVINLLKKIQNENNKNVCKMFFIDKDFDKSIYSHSKLYEIEDVEDIYETESYSIENYYVSEYTIGKILDNEFNIMEDEEDYKKCIRDFNVCLNEYNEIMLDFNAILFAYKRKKGLSNKLSFGDRKLKDFAKISLEHVERSRNYKNVIDILLEESKVNEREFNISKKILMHNNMTNIFRGKNQLEFLVKFIDLLIENRKRYFKRSNISVTISNNTHKLTEFCNYAYTPDRLKQFINVHFEKFCQTRS